MYQIDKYENIIMAVALDSQEDCNVHDVNNYTVIFNDLCKRCNVFNDLQYY